MPIVLPHLEDDVATAIGPALVLVFCASQALRDVYFGHVFQGVDFFTVIVVAFALSTLIFSAIAAIRTPGEFRKLRGHAPTIIAMNFTTALAWICYFFGLTHIEPSVVNALHSGMGPLTVLALAALGFPLARTAAVNWGEYLGYAAMALSLVGLWWVVLSGASGLPAANESTTLAGLALLLVSGASITISLLYCKRLHDQGINAEVVTSIRYVALILVAAAAVGSKGGNVGIDSMTALAQLAVTTTVLIVLPLFALQLSIARTATLTANVLRSLGPVFVFAVEQWDGRMSYSAPTLACLLAYSAAAIGSSVAHAAGRRGDRAPPAAVPAEPVLR
jgi:drug/metabolite transporter (DMT)-like permease